MSAHPNAVTFALAARFVEDLEREQATRPRRAITAYKLWLPGHTPHYAFLCSECFRTLQEPVRAERFAPAPHARGCDWCHCFNDAEEESAG